MAKLKNSLSIKKKYSRKSIKTSRKTSKRSRKIKMKGGVDYTVLDEDKKFYKIFKKKISDVEKMKDYLNDEELAELNTLKSELQRLEFDIMRKELEIQFNEEMEFEKIKSSLEKPTKRNKFDILLEAMNIEK